MEDGVALLSASEFEVDEAAGFEGFEGAVLLGFVAFFELLKGDCLELDGGELLVLWEWWVLVWSELGRFFFVRHVGCCQSLFVRAVLGWR